LLNIATNDINGLALPTTYKINRIKLFCGDFTGSLPGHIWVVYVKYYLNKGGGLVPKYTVDLESASFRDQESGLRLTSDEKLKVLEKMLKKARENNRAKKSDRKKPKSPHRLYFTDKKLRGLKPKAKQYLVWDAWTNGRTRGDDVAKGLCVLVSPKGAKSYRALYSFPGSTAPHYKHLGRVGELSLAEARKLCGEVRHLARQGHDPHAGDPAKSGTFEVLFREWIQQEQIGRLKLKSARLTESFTLNNCAAFAARPVASIQYAEIEKLLATIRDGTGDKKPRPAAAIRIYAHLHSFFKWCARHGGPLQRSPMDGMPSPAPHKPSERFYTDAEVRKIWHAADKLDPLEGGYVKLTFLLATRREELAQAKWAEFDSADAPTLFTIPFVRTKGKATRKPINYLVPLPKLASRILKSLPKRDDGTLFPRIDYADLKASLVKAGAPKDFKLHAARHTIATYLQNTGRSEFERGLVLNHASSGVTAGYSHGHATDLKRNLLEEWADHVKQLVQPDKDVGLLR
jgi:integrase